jgi:putative transposase
MYGKIKKDVWEILKKLCEYKRIEILEGTVCADHVHLCVKIPPKSGVSACRGYLKGKSALMVFDRRPEFKKYGDKHFWAKGYYVDTAGRNEEQLRRYIKDQEETDKLEKWRKAPFRGGRQRSWSSEPRLLGADSNRPL